MATSSSIKEVVQKTSIVLGYDPTPYTSTYNATHLSNNRPSALSQDDIERCRAVKADLRATHFNLGDHPQSYETSNKLLDPTGNMHKYTAKLNVEAKSMLRKTSATLGYDTTQYDTSTSRATSWNKKAMQNSIALREAQKNDSQPGKVHYNFGDERTAYLSASKEAFTYDHKTVIKATMDDEVKNDLRKCHYTLGNDNLDYSTSNAMPEVSIELLEGAKGKIDDSSNPWRVNICLTHE